MVKEGDQGKHLFGTPGLLLLLYHSTLLDTIQSVHQYACVLQQGLESEVSIDLLLFSWQLHDGDFPVVFEFQLDLAVQSEKNYQNGKNK